MLSIVKAYLLILLLTAVSPLSYGLAFGHGVHSGVIGCPVNACGANNWSKLGFMKDVTFQSTLILYGLIVGICVVSMRRVAIAKIRKNL